MPNVAQVLKQEISRLARKEVRSTFNPLRKQVQSLRHKVRQQQGVIDKLQRSLTKVVEQTASETGSALYAPTDSEDSQARISPSSIRRHRLRLGLSQAELGKLLSVSTNTVVRWEQGASKPRVQHRTALARMREMRVREVRRILSE